MWNNLDSFKCLGTTYSPLTDKNFVDKFRNLQNASGVSQQNSISAFFWASEQSVIARKQGGKTDETENGFMYIAHIE